MALERVEAFLQAGELDDALGALNQHLQAHSDDDDARRLRIDLLLRLPGRARDALAELRALPRLTEDDQAKYLGAMIRFGLADEVETPTFEYPPESTPSQLTATFLTLLYQRRETERGLALLASLPKTTPWLGWSGDFYAQKGDYPSAAEHFCLAVKGLGTSTDPLIAAQRAALLLKRADAYRRLKRWKEADADYRAAESIIPTDPLIPFNRGLLIFEQGNLRGALPLCRDALDHAPEGLRDHMRAVLTDEPRYKTLAQALLG